MAKEPTIFYNNKKCNCKINCRAGNLNLSLNHAGATNMILNRRPPDSDEEDIPDICDRHTITTRTALRNEHNHIQNNNHYNNNDPEKTNYQQHQRRQQQQHSYKSHSHQNQQHRKSQQHQTHPTQHHNRNRHHHPRRHHHYIVLQNNVIIIIILLLFIKILFVNCQQPTQIDQQLHPQQQHHHHQPQQHPPSSSANDFRSSSSHSNSKKELTTSSVCSGSCSQDKATAKEIQLKSMQQHILARLKFTQLPNMSYVPHVPENIIADFMRSTQQHQQKENSKKYQRKSTWKTRKNGGYYTQQTRHQKRSHSVTDDDYQGDAPAFDNNYDYQGDAPISDHGDDEEEEFVEFEEDDFDDDYDDDDDLDDDDEPFYSVVDKVYIIPTVTTISKYTHCFLVIFFLSPFFIYFVCVWGLTLGIVSFGYSRVVEKDFGRIFRLFFLSFNR